MILDFSLWKKPECDNEDDSGQLDITGRLEDSKSTSKMGNPDERVCY